MKRLQSFVISGKHFNSEHTFTCGQFFRYKKEGDSFFVNSLDKYAKISKQGNDFLVETFDTKYFKEFLALEDDYEQKKMELSAFDFLKNPIEFGHGIRILHQNLFEAIICFIVSQNNNIKRIKKIIESLCEKCGTKIQSPLGEFFAFPTREQLQKLSYEELCELGLGYRARYIKDVLPLLSDEFLGKLKVSTTIEARQLLVALPGIGRKVADCILLFGLGRDEVFPVDVWCERIYFSYFSAHAKSNTQIAKSREKISNYLSEVFGENAGLAQQYLFFFERSHKS